MIVYMYVLQNECCRITLWERSYNVIRAYNTCYVYIYNFDEHARTRAIALMAKRECVMGRLSTQTHTHTHKPHLRDEAVFETIRRRAAADKAGGRGVSGGVTPRENSVCTI